MDKKSTMRKALLLLILMLALQLHGCFRDDCEKTEASLIEFGIDFGGTVIVTSTETGLDLTSQFKGAELNIMMYKVYCSKKINGPFEEKFTLADAGLMWPETLGYFSFKMDNLLDYLDLNFFFEGFEVGQTGLDYDLLVIYNGTKLIENYRIEIFWNETLNSPERSRTKIIRL